LLQLVLPGTTGGDSPEKRKEATAIIANFANDICGSISVIGKSSDLQLTGEAKAGLKGITRKLAAKSTQPRTPNPIKVEHPIQ